MIEQSDGKKVEHFTVEEVKAAELKAVDEFKKENPNATEDQLKKAGEDAVTKHLKDNPPDEGPLKEATTAKEEAEAKLVKAEKELKDAQENDTDQVSRLRGERDKAKEGETKALKDLKELTEGTAARLTKLEKGGVNRVKDAIFKKVAGDDQDILNKLNKEFDGFEGDVSTEEDVTRRANNSATIVNSESPIPNFTDNITGSGSKGDGAEVKTGKEFSEGEQQTSKTLNITEKEQKEQIERESKRDEENK